MQWFKKFLIITSLTCASLYSYAQIPTDSLPGDPGGFYVYTTQNLTFGSFYHRNTSGTITIGNDGSRTVTGDVVPLNMGTFNNAIFEIETPPGTIISIMNGPNVTLLGSNGGSVTLTIGNSFPSAPFTTTFSPPSRTQIRVGGTLAVGNNATTPPGNYSGNFIITFNHQ